MRTFLSYGHDEYASVAEAVASTLKRHGYEVWFDVDALRPAVDWEHTIETGLDWVSEDPDQGRLILIMTPHSVRRPDGYCLNEVARALDRRIRIVPVMLVQVEPPLSICRLQWLDMTMCVPVGERRALFDRQIEQLLEVLASDSPQLDGGQGRLRAMLDPISFDAELTAVRDFVERHWVAEEFDAWLSDPHGNQLFWLVGGPGTGKTAINLHLAATHREVAAWHFCQRGHVVKSDARRAVMSIAYQIATQLPEYHERLLAAAEEVSNGEVTNAATVFDQLVLQPLAMLPDPGRVIVVIIDGLDEATIAGRNELAELIGQGRLGPRWLRFWVASRSEEPLRSLLRGATSLDLTRPRARADADLRRYFAVSLADVRRGPHRGDDGDILDHLVTDADGSFLWARTTVEGILAGRMLLGTAWISLPTSVASQYSSELRWRLGWPGPWPGAFKADYKQRLRPLFEIVAAQRETLPMETLGAILGWDDYSGPEIIASAGSLLQDADGGARFHHASFLEWVTDKEQADDFWVSTRRGHARLAGASPRDLGRYGDRHHVAHMIGAGRARDAAHLLSDPARVAAQLVDEEIDALVNDTVSVDERRRDARFGVRSAIVELARSWPARENEAPVIKCVDVLRRVAWLRGPDRIQSTQSACGALTTAVYLADDLAGLGRRWLTAVPLVLDDALKNLLDDANSSERIGDDVTGFDGLATATADVVARWRDDPALQNWRELWGDRAER